MASPRERDHRGEVPPGAVTRWSSDPRSAPMRTAPPQRRHHFHDMPPWPHQYHHDYVAVEGWGWWPRWYPYWDPRWYAYWWSLYDYYGGDAYPEYAEYARDSVLRTNAPQWGLVVSGDYRGTQVGIQPYGVLPAASRYPAQGHGRLHQVSSYRVIALDSARRIYEATGGVLFGYRDSPWGSELTAFGTRAGLQRWANEQSMDPDIWYAAAFDLNASSSPLSEVAR